MTDLFDKEQETSPMPNKKPPFDYKYWLQNLILGGILTVCSLCLSEIQKQREFRIGAEIRLQDQQTQITSLNISTGMATERGKNNLNDISVLWALVPGTIKFKRSYER